MSPKFVLHIKGMVSILAAALVVSASLPHEDPRFNTPMINPHPEEAMMPTVSGLDDPQLLFHVIGEGPEDILGTSMDGVGDINQDGYDDVILATMYTGYAYLYYGGNPMDSIPDITFGDGIAQYFCPTNVGDVNGDSIQDFVLFRHLNSDLEEVWFYYGGIELDSIPDLIFYEENIGDGFGLLGGGDFNGDYYSDIAITAFDCNYYQGQVYIFFGSEEMDNIPDITFTSPDSIPMISFGNVINTGNLNGDDYCDILTGNPGDYLIYFGSAEFDTIPEFYLEPNYPNTSPLEINDDVNLDGCDDIAMSSNYFSSGFEALVYFGSDSIGIEPDLHLKTLSSSYIISIADAGDVNGDGCGDVILGNFGSAKVFLGGQYMDEYPDITFGGSGAGWQVGKAGDVNGDGVDDIMYSQKYYSSGANGQVFIYAGDTSWVVGVEEKPDFAIPNNFNTLSNYPNPFNSSTTITFTLDTPETVWLCIYDVLGQEVAVLLNQQRAAGSYQLKWNADGSPSGVYYSTIIIGNYSKTRPLLLLK